jgi:hypothetical protein
MGAALSQSAIEDLLHLPNIRNETKKDSGTDHSEVFGCWRKRRDDNPIWVK